MTEEHKEYDHVGMMQDEGEWVRWPVLPLRRRRKEAWPQVGLFLAGAGPVVFLANMYDKTPLGEVENVKYETYQAAFDDGWRVD